MEHGQGRSTQPSLKGAFMFKASNISKILPGLQDGGDDEFIWVAIRDKEKGRFDVKPPNIDMAIKPICTVQADWIGPAPERD